MNILYLHGTDDLSFFSLFCVVILHLCAVLRWVHYDMPGTTRADVWTKDEDMTIIEQAAEFQGTEWVQVAAAVKEETVAGMAGGAGRGGGIGKGVGQGRTPIACLKRYQRALNMELVNAQRWTEEEDARLMKAIQVGDVSDVKETVFAHTLSLLGSANKISRWTSHNTNNIRVCLNVEKKIWPPA